MPKYSPDLNPIEQTIAKIKHRMRLAQKRTTEDTWRHLGYLVGTIKPDERANYFEKRGRRFCQNIKRSNGLGTKRSDRLSFDRDGLDRPLSRSVAAPAA